MALLPIFCVARSSRTNLSRIVARALKIGKIADGGMPPTYETMHYLGRHERKSAGELDRDSTDSPRSHENHRCQ
jgi:hypothetical protein